MDSGLIRDFVPLSCLLAVAKVQAEEIRDRDKGTGMDDRGAYEEYIAQEEAALEAAQCSRCQLVHLEDDEYTRGWALARCQDEQVRLAQEAEDESRVAGFRLLMDAGQQGAPEAYRYS